jgi:hypothetical protein
MAVKSFIVQAFGGQMFVGQMAFGLVFFYQKMRNSSFHRENVRPNVIKLFLSVLYGFFVVS